MDSDIIKNINISNTYIILVDDDLIYKPYMIEHFDNFIKLNKSDVCSYCVYNYHNIKIDQGADGFLIKYSRKNLNNNLNKTLNELNKLGHFDFLKI